MNSILIYQTFHWRDLIKRTLYISLSIFLGLQVVCSPEPSPLLFADGGYISEQFTPNSNPYQYLIFSLQGKNLKQGMRVCGSIAHPYGEGPFNVIHSPIIDNASITATSERIEFSFVLNTAHSDQLVTLFSAEPIWDEANAFSRPNNLIYDGAYIDYSNYPFRLQWLTNHVVDRTDQNVAVEVKSNPVVIYDDRERVVKVQTEGFEKQVVNIELSGLNGVDFYPPIDMYALQMGIFLYGVDLYPLTFDVTFSDGTIDRIVSKYSYPVILQPTSAIDEWLFHY